MVENLATNVSRAARFRAGGSLQTSKNIEDCIHVIPHADGPLARRLVDDFYGFTLAFV